MNIRDYQFMNTLDTGTTTYEAQLVSYFNIDSTKTANEVRDILTGRLQMKEYTLGDYIWFNDKKWLIEKEILDGTFEQWTRLETLLSEDDNISNLHKLLAIYIRPATRQGLFKKEKIEPFDMNKQDDLAEELLDLPLEIANAAVLFFYQLVPEFMDYIKIHYLNQANQQLNISIKNLSMS